MKISNSIIEHVLETNRSHLGKHYEMYKNHVYRVFILCQMLDSSTDNLEKYAIASVFHDLGIWTFGTFDYLDPSIATAKKYLVENGKKQWVDEISTMIEMHHKRSKYNGPFEQTVENFRRSDWIDVTKGRISFNISNDIVDNTISKYPLLGFHRFLILQTLKSFFKSPFNPLPMFKK